MIRGGKREYVPIIYFLVWWKIGEYLRVNIINIKLGEKLKVYFQI